MKPIDMQPCESSRIQAIGHCPETNTLAIQFKAKNGPGSVYHYSGVTADVHKAFADAESKGKFFGEIIQAKDDEGGLKYPYTKFVADAEKEPA